MGDTGVVGDPALDRTSYAHRLRGLAVTGLLGTLAAMAATTLAAALAQVPPLIAGADTATRTALVGLHLVAAAMMVPAVVRSLRTRTG